MPQSLVSVLRSNPVSVLRRAISAFGTNAPEGSLTAPVIVPEPEPCAQAWPAGSARSARKANTNIICFRRRPSRKYMVSSPLNDLNLIGTFQTKRDFGLEEEAASLAPRVETHCLKIFL